MKKILLIAVIAGFTFAGCSKDDIQPSETQNRTELQKTGANEQLDPKIEQFVLDGVTEMDNKGTNEYYFGTQVLRRLCQTSYYSEDGVTFISGSYEQYGTLVIKVVRIYIMREGFPLQCSYVLTVASPLWNCNDLPGGPLVDLK